MVYKSGQIFLPFCHNTRVWRTDRQTDRILLAIPRLHYMQRSKKWQPGKDGVCLSKSLWKKQNCQRSRWV